MSPQDALSPEAAARTAQAMLGGTPEALREARLLLAHALGLDRGRLHLLAGMNIQAEQIPIFGALVARRQRGEPISHILGYREFWKHRFQVGADVLDPRPETETLVAAALRAPFARMLDLGTGSGCIAVSLLAERPAARGVAVDVSAPALAVAARNAASIGVAERLDLIQSDWFAGVEGRFDLIVSNPPYIAQAEMAGLSPEVRDWEPHLALTPGGDGLGAYRAIATGAPAHLAPGGRLLVEIGPSQAEAVAGLFAAAGLAGIAVLRDLDGRDRVVAARAA